MENTDQESAPLIANNDRPRDLAITVTEHGLLEPVPECCIYKAPIRFREANEKVYTPQLISIGPVFHGNKNLALMERQKQRYYENFLRGTSVETLKKTASYIENNLEPICRCYEAQFVFELEASKFIKIISYDAVFIIELFLRTIGETDDDNFFRGELLRVELPTDLMLLENQLPFFVLEDIYNRAFPEPAAIFSFLDLACWYFDVNKDLSLDEREIKHFTDLIRYQVMSSYPPNSLEGIRNLYSATMLQEAGVKFIGVKNDEVRIESVGFVGRKPEVRNNINNLLNVKFEKGVLELQIITIEYETEIRFRNLMAFEQCHYPKEAYFCSYILLLDSLVDTSEDVDLLVKKGIIVNRLGSSAAVADMINNLAVGVVHSVMLYGQIGRDLNRYYHSSWNRRWTTLKHVYFNNLWRGTATIAAFIVVMLTLTQTVLAILDRSMPTK
ncbi:UPF0481 protein At3g47200-like [Herrania umbratica]|uniref:UPF0481 protein At3g47200-like n=1 Tax=Herrania umbratica TaxID=108875 RepID=A0A6J1A0S8_9ROSI|nr:UPF0481 protein At3g47200-like [Herrania umbratica]XP_021280412.1 UPF0481 protein At3g47200-like [Herrania umbratica]XP_021280413.1 UPF0481 protein At3g47200-like [Herrania umbratica]